MKPFYQTRLSNGRKIELSREQYELYLKQASWKLNNAPILVSASDRPSRKQAKLVRTHLELGGHLKG